MSQRSPKCARRWCGCSAISRRAPAAPCSTAAKRRAIELAGRGERVDYPQILAEIVKRDARDEGRPDAPMRAATDATRLDTTQLSVEGVFEAAVGIVDSRRSAV